MRRLPALLAAASLVGGACIWIAAGLLTNCWGSMWPNHAPIGARVVSHVTRDVITRVMPLVVTSAHAADVMEFKPVPAESVTSIERRVRRQRTVVDIKTQAELTGPLARYRRQVGAYASVVARVTGRPARAVLMRL